MDISDHQSVTELPSPGTPEEPLCFTYREPVDHLRHDGGLRPVVGVHSYQVLRANRERPELAGGSDWTYNHQPYLAYWNEQFYLQYLSSPVAEHEDAGQTLLTTSPDGEHWSAPRVVFPPYPFPDGSFSIMHQRMGFYRSRSDRLLTLAFYSHACPYPWPERWDGPNDGKGVGRVVREIYRDGTFGPIYFIRYNRHAGWDEHNTNYPFYRSAPDVGFVAACEELLANRLMTMQWWEEDKSPDGFYPVQGYKAFCWYQRPDRAVVGLWKFGKAALSFDEGHTWTPVVDLPGLPTAGAKTWGQRTQDGQFAIAFVHNREDAFRWPLVLAVGADGIRFERVLAIEAHLAPMRYTGFCKNPGLQYVRGIEPGNGIPPDGDLWLTYSANKEDIWVSRIPVPVRAVVNGPVCDTFEENFAGKDLRDWNIRSGLLAPVQRVEFPAGNHCLELCDQDPYDEACAVRVFAESRRPHISLRLWAGQTTHGWLALEILDAHGKCPVQIVLTNRGWLLASAGKEYCWGMRYQAQHWYTLDLPIDVETQTFTLRVDGETIFSEAAFVEQVASLERLSLRTGPQRREPTPDIAWHIHAPDLPNAGIPVCEAIYRVDDVLIEEIFR